MSTAILSIPKRAKSCHKSEEAFKEGDAYYSVLLKDEATEGSFLRHDYSAKEWSAELEKELRTRSSSIWKAKIPFKKEKKKRPITPDEKAIEYFWELQKAEEAEAETGTIYVLAMYLERFRKLAYRHKSRQKGKNYLLYEHVESGKVIAVEDQRLNNTELRALQEKISARIRVEDEKESAETTPSEEDAEPSAEDSLEKNLAEA